MTLIYNKYVHSLTQKDVDEEKQLCLKFSREIAQGMFYLSYKGYIHRDLAARNVVLAGKTCKVSCHY